MIVKINSSDKDFLKNPAWHALNTIHSEFCIGTNVKRYPGDISVFASIESASACREEDILEVVSPNEKIVFIGQIPKLSSHWSMLLNTHVTQMICQRAMPIRQVSAEVRTLSLDDRPQMLDLTNKVFPGYFKFNSIKMGKFIGVFEGSKLVSMAGTRLRVPGYVETSTLCTLPEYTGKGFASHLFTTLSNGILAEGATPFLHIIEPRDLPKIKFYEKIGYYVHDRIPVQVLQYNTNE